MNKITRGLSHRNLFNDPERWADSDMTRDDHVQMAKRAMGACLLFLLGLICILVALL